MTSFLWQPHLIIVIAASILYDWFFMSTASKIVIAASIKKSVSVMCFSLLPYPTIYGIRGKCRESCSDVVLTHSHICQQSYLQIHMHTSRRASEL